jgi:hypothetical protein
MSASREFEELDPLADLVKLYLGKSEPLMHLREHLVLPGWVVANAP